jgi:uracil-DNA glycosylase
MTCREDSMEEILKVLEKNNNLENVTNQYSDEWKYHSITRNNLKRYFEQMMLIKPTILLVGEAPGYNGCRLTGVPFTSEQIIYEQINYNGLFGKGNGYLVRKAEYLQKEPTATIVWQALKEQRITPLLWNAFPFHPHQNYNKESNRSPNKAELIFGVSVLKMVINMFDIKRVISVGKTSYELLNTKSIQSEYIRHPSYGGKQEFESGLRKEYQL